MFTIFLRDEIIISNKCILPIIDSDFLAALLHLVIKFPSENVQISKYMIIASQRPKSSILLKFVTFKFVKFNIFIFFAVSEISLQSNIHWPSSKKYILQIKLSSKINPIPNKPFSTKKLTAPFTVYTPLTIFYSNQKPH